MIKCKKQFIAFFMAISIVFCVGSQSYIKAEALEWAVPTITAGEAIKWLLGLLGVTVAGGALANTDWEQLADNYSTYAHNQGLTAVETGKFWQDIIDGTLDQGSEAWTKFKEWVISLTTTSSSANLTSFAYTYNYVFDFSNISTDFDNYNFNLILASDTPSLSSTPSRFYFFNASSVSVGNSLSINYIGGYYYATYVNSNIYKIYSSGSFDNSSLNISFPNSVTGYYIAHAADLPFSEVGSYVLKNPLFNFDFDSSDSNFIAYNPSLINTLALTLSSAISDAIPDVIPLPWDQVAGTAEGINEKIDELIEKVNEGVISIEQYMEAVQAIMGVLAFDTTNDLVIPADPALPDWTIKDEVDENQKRHGFTLSGLENFFPFCIPFDIYAFITILVADPVAPVIHWHIYNPVTKSDNIMTLDFAMWEPVVILFRYIFDFLFIIGLALIARTLIGGED